MIDLPPRGWEIFEEIVGYHMTHREPVSARRLAKISALTLSPTSIRNLMEDLAAVGLLTTSSGSKGREPTAYAYALYVNQLNQQPAHKPESAPSSFADVAFTNINEAPDAAHVSKLQPLLRHVSSQLAQMSDWVVFICLPAPADYPIDWIKLSPVPVPRAQVLVSVHSLFGDLWSKLVENSASLTGDSLQQITYYLCENYRGHSLAEARELLSQEARWVPNDDAPSRGTAFRMLRKMLEWPSQRQWQVCCPQNALNLPASSNAEQFAQLQALLNDPDPLWDILHNGNNIRGSKIAIGIDATIPALEHCALLGYPFGFNHWNGWLMVLGPMWMNYEAVLTKCEQTVHHLNKHMAQFSS